MQNLTFDDIFISDKRALYIGDLEEVCHGRRCAYHSMPSWFGLSGSMVGVIEKGQPIIIGLSRSCYHKLI